MRFPGIIPAVTTPSPPTGEVDVAALRANVARLLDAGVHGLVGTGTMGEAGSLSTRERRDVVAAIVEAADGRVPGHRRRLRRHRRQARSPTRAHAADAGAVALMCLPPLGYRGDERRARRLLRRGRRRRRAAAHGLQQPGGLAASTCRAALIARIAEARRAASSRSRSARATRGASPRCCTPPSLEVLVGGDDWALEGFCAGATGWVSGVADVAPARVRRALRALPRGRARRRARGLPAAAAARAPRHDAQARAVLQGRDGRGRPRRRPDARAAPAARRDAERADAARGARRARAWRSAL